MKRWECIIYELWLGLKRRTTAPALPKDLDRLNEEARTLYYREDCQIIDALNALISDDMPKLRAPDPRFNRKLEDYAAKTYSVEGGVLLRGEYEDHLKHALPGPTDAKVLDAIFKDKNWMAAGTA